MRSSLVASLAVLALASCVDLSLPPRPAPPGPGSVQGTLVYAVPGRTSAEPAAGARVQLANSTLATVAGEDGYFRLENLVTQGGTLLIQFDVDGDGAPDRQRRLDLGSYGAGFGKDVSLGTVLLGRNATVVGVARRGDLAGQSTGHAGTSVFVPEGPFATQTADDGSFLLEAMPEGPLTLAFFRPGYESTVQSTTLRAGERLQLETVLLTVKPTADLPGTLAGTVLQADGAAAEGATIALPGLGTVATTDAEGRFTATVPAGLYAVTVAKPGFVTVVVPNVLVGSGATANIGLLLVPVGSGAGGGGGGAVGGGGGSVGGGGGSVGGGGGSVGGGGGGGAGGGDGQDAGADDAGPGDGGAGDAGLGDAGAGGGTGADGGTDAGGLPVAIIEPHPASYLPSSPILLSGALSTGAQPLLYEWRQTSPADGGFHFPDFVSGGTNGSRSAFEIRTMTPWWYPERYELQLVVTDALGRVSPPATTSFVVSSVPTATIEPVPASVGSGTVFTVSGANSQDTNVYPLPLTQFAWSAAAGSPTLTPNALLNGREVQVRAPIVAVPTILRLRLRVTNSLGVSAETESTNIVVAPLGDAGTWQLTATASSTADAGTVLTVPSLSAVTLRADVQTTIPDAGFTYTWSPLSDPLGGWSLTGANTPRATFVAPKVVGATRTLQFTTTVNTTAMDLIPAQRTAQVTVAVVDEDPPAVVSTTFPSGTGSVFGATVSFDEDIEFGLYTYADVIDASNYQVGVGRVVKGRSIVFKPTAPWVVGQTYRVRLRAIYDLSPARNFFPRDYETTYLSFVASLGVSAPFESADQSVGEPFPGLLLGTVPPPPTDGGMPQQPVLQLFGRRSASSPGPESAWFLQSRSAWAFGCPPTPVGSPCPLPSLSTGPTPALAADAGVPIKRSFTFDAGPIGVLEVRSPSDAGVAILATTSGAGSPSLVVPAGAAPGPVGVGPQGLVSAGVAADGTLGFAAVNRLTNTWVDEAFGPLVDWHPGGELAVVATAHNRVVVGQTASSRWMRVAWGSSEGWLAGEFSSSVTSSPRLVVKPSPAGQPPADDFIAFGLAELTTTTHLVARNLGRYPTSLYSNGSYDVLGTTWITSYDVLHDDGLIYVAHVIGGELRVRVWPWAAGFDLSTSTLVPGAHPGGVMNVSPSCEAAHPELLAADDFLYLAWQERCPGQDWKMVYRVLH